MSNHAQKTEFTQVMEEVIRTVNDMPDHLPLPDVNYSIDSHALELCWHLFQGPQVVTDMANLLAWFDSPGEWKQGYGRITLDAGDYEATIFYPLDFALRHAETSSEIDALTTTAVTGGQK